MNTLPGIHSASLRTQLRPVLRSHRWLMLIIGMHTMSATWLYFHYPEDNSVLLLLGGFTTTLLIGPVFALCGYAMYVMVFIRPRRLLYYLYSNLRDYLTRARLLHALPAILMIPLFACSFTITKAAVPLLQPYAWDSRLALLDQRLHGGVQPWVLLQGLVGFPPVTALLNLAYELWFIIMFAVMYWLVFNTSRAQLRMQFLLSFVLSWILLGNVGAILLSSAGPCYYSLVVHGPDPYAALMQYLHLANRHLPIDALAVQKLLWQGYQQHVGVSGLTISAMPSMHVTTAVLLALVGCRVSRPVGIALTLFAIAIMVGSIHLGWHYAVDGYVGAAGALLIWNVVGLLLRHTPASVLPETAA